MLVDDGAADGEAEAGSALLAGIGGLDLLEAVEDGLELVLRDAAALVRDAELEHVEGGLERDGNRRVGWRELDGVREEVGEDLEDAVGVTVEVHRAAPLAPVRSLLRRSFADAGLARAAIGLDVGGAGFGEIEVLRAALLEAAVGVRGFPGFRMPACSGEKESAT